MDKTIGKIDLGDFDSVFFFVVPLSLHFCLLHDSTLAMATTSASEARNAPTHENAIAGPSHRPVSPSPFPRLAPALSRLSISRVQSPPLRSDGLDNYPPPLPHDLVELERRLTQDPEIERQMAGEDIGPPPEGGKDAWLCVSGAFFVLFCIFGFATSFGQLKIYYRDHQLQGYSESEIAYVHRSPVLLLLIPGGYRLFRRF